MNPIKWLWRKIRHKKDDRVAAIKQNGETVAIIATKEAIREYLPKKMPEPLITEEDVKAARQHVSFTQVLDEMIADRKREEETIRERWLPKPTTRRKTRDKPHRPPAAEHADRIARLMKGKGSKRTHKTYKQMRKARVPIKEPEDD